MSNTDKFEINIQGELTRYNGDESDVLIPDGVTKIGNFAFYQSSQTGESGRCGPKSITIPDRATLPSLHPQNNYCTL